jgi:hypothetical protein
MWFAMGPNVGVLWTRLFWNLPLRRWVGGSKRPEGTYCLFLFLVHSTLENEENMYSRNVVKYTTSRRRLYHCENSDLSRSLTSVLHKINGISWVAWRPTASQVGTHLHASQPQAVLTRVRVWVTCNSVSYLGYVSATTAPKIIPASVYQLIVTSHLAMCRPWVWTAWRTWHCFNCRWQMVPTTETVMI